jgi:hypothetical protein
LVELFWLRSGCPCPESLEAEAVHGKRDEVVVGTGRVYRQQWVRTGARSADKLQLSAYSEWALKERDSRPAKQRLY